MHSIEIVFKDGTNVQTSHDLQFNHRNNSVLIKVDREVKKYDIENIISINPV